MKRLLIFFFLIIFNYINSSYSKNIRTDFHKLHVLFDSVILLDGQIFFYENNQDTTVLIKTRYNIENYIKASEIEKKLVSNFEDIFIFDKKNNLNIFFDSKNCLAFTNHKELISTLGLNLNTITMIPKNCNGNNYKDYENFIYFIYDKTFWLYHSDLPNVVLAMPDNNQTQEFVLIDLNNTFPNISFDKDYDNILIQNKDTKIWERKEIGDYGYSEFKFYLDNFENLNLNLEKIKQHKKLISNKKIISDSDLNSISSYLNNVVKKYNIKKDLTLKSNDIQKVTDYFVDIQEREPFIFEGIWKRKSKNKLEEAILFIKNTNNDEYENSFLKVTYDDEGKIESQLKENNNQLNGKMFMSHSDEVVNVTYKLDPNNKDLLIETYNQKTNYLERLFPLKNDKANIISAINDKKKQREYENKQKDISEKKELQRIKTEERNEAIEKFITGPFGQIIIYLPLGIFVIYYLIIYSKYSGLNRPKNFEDIIENVCSWNSRHIFNMKITRKDIKKIKLFNLPLLFMNGALEVDYDIEKDIYETDEAAYQIAKGNWEQLDAQDKHWKKINNKHVGSPYNPGAKPFRSDFRKFSHTNKSSGSKFVDKKTTSNYFFITADGYAKITSLDTNKLVEKTLEYFNERYDEIIKKDKTLYKEYIKKPDKYSKNIKSIILNKDEKNKNNQEFAKYVAKDALSNLDYSRVSYRYNIPNINYKFFTIIQLKFDKNTSEKEFIIFSNGKVIGSSNNLDPAKCIMGTILLAGYSYLLFI
jgi:hypothetical protein